MKSMKTASSSILIMGRLDRSVVPYLDYIRIYEYCNKFCEDTRKNRDRVQEVVFEAPRGSNCVPFIWRRLLVSFALANAQI